MLRKSSWRKSLTDTRAPQGYPRSAATRVCGRDGGQPGWRRPDVEMLEKDDDEVAYLAT